MNLQKIDVFAIEQPAWTWSSATPETLHTLAESLKRSGQLRPIHVAEIPENFAGQQYMVLDGVTVVQAASLAGLTQLWAIVYPEMDEVTAMTRAVELNLCGGELRSPDKCHAALSKTLGTLAETMKVADVQALTTMDVLDLASYIELHKQGFKWHEYSGPPRKAGNRSFFDTPEE